jgi:hypothetical protein
VGQPAKDALGRNGEKDGQLPTVGEVPIDRLLRRERGASVDITLAGFLPSGAQR